MNYHFLYIHYHYKKDILIIFYSTFVSNFYKYQKKVRQAIDEKLNQMEEPTQFAALPIPKTENLPSHAPETSTKIILRQDNLELEIPDGTSREIILALLEGLKC